MKKLFLLFTVFVLIVGTVYSQQLNLDTAIERSARAVEEVLPQGTKVAILNFASTSETFSDHVIDELTGKLVNGRKITIVDRRNLALITQEMNLQLSGDVSDESAQAIGRMLGAQSIISGNLTNMGNFYRFRIRVINVETAAIQTQISLDLQNDEQVAFLLRGSQHNVPSVITTSPNTSTTGVAAPSIEGTVVPGANLPAKLTWLQRNADSHNTYILEINANENITPQTFEYSGTINITIVLRGIGGNHVIRLSSHGTMFTIRPNVTMILENNITLQGHSGNNASLVIVDGGNLRMYAGTAITGNTKSSGGGGGIDIPRGTFTMNGGTISNNIASSGNGGGVCVCGGTFTMNNGIISGNSAVSGGGVQVHDQTFTMSGGVISGNSASSRGGGVFIVDGRMSSVFIMRNGTITGNTARSEGGGVFVTNNRYCTFTKTGGTITGFNSDQNNGNVVRDDDGTIARRGHAAFVSTDRRKETTAGTGVNLSRDSNVGWDN